MGSFSPSQPTVGALDGCHLISQQPGTLRPRGPTVYPIEGRLLKTRSALEDDSVPAVASISSAAAYRVSGPLRHARPANDAPAFSRRGEGGSRLTFLSTCKPPRRWQVPPNE